MSETSETVKACPECDTVKIQKRKTLKPDYRCRICSEEFAEPATRPNRRHTSRGGGGGLLSEAERYENEVVPALRKCVANNQRFARARDIAEYVDGDMSATRIGHLLHNHGLDRDDVSVWADANIARYQIHVDAEEGDA
jgi:hypothetical protein